MRVCLEPGCPTLVRAGRCTLHGGQRLGVPRRNVNAPTARLILRRADGKCEHCRRKTQTLIIHHLRPRSEGGSDHPDNLQAVCMSCHAKLHGWAERETGDYRARR